MSVNGVIIRSRKIGFEKCDMQNGGHFSASMCLREESQAVTKSLSESMLIEICDAIGPQQVNTLRLRQNGCHFPDDIFKCIFLMKMFEFRLRFLKNLFPMV